MSELLKLVDPRYRKWLIAVIGLAGQVALMLQAIIGSGLLYGKALTITQAVLAGLTAVGVRVVENVRDTLTADGSNDVADELTDDEPDRPSPHPHGKHAED